MNKKQIVDELVEETVAKFKELQDELRESLIDIGCSGRYEHEYQKGLVKIFGELFSHPSIRVAMPIVLGREEEARLESVIKPSDYIGGNDAKGA